MDRHDSSGVWAALLGRLPPPHPPGVLGGRRMWQEDEEAAWRLAVSFCGGSDDG